MTLKIELKAGEKIIVGSAVITNGDSRTTFYIDGNQPLLREKDIMTAERANTPARRIYLAVQLIYLNEDMGGDHKDLYFRLIDEFLEAAPSALPLIDSMNDNIVSDAPYQALKKAKQLIKYEQELIDNASYIGRGGLSEDKSGNRQSARAGSEHADKGGDTPSGRPG